MACPMVSHIVIMSELYCFVKYIILSTPAISQIALYVSLTGGLQRLPPHLLAASLQRWPGPSSWRSQSVHRLVRCPEQRVVVQVALRAVVCGCE
jgi:hypothetical protein